MMRCRLCFEGDQKKAFVVVFQSMAAFFQSVKRVRKFKLQNYILSAFSSCVKNVQFHSQKD